eukprot:scaffold130849_cov23-Tisochrysis_lutea.AAC.1
MIQLQSRAGCNPVAVPCIGNEGKVTRFHQMKGCIPTHAHTLCCAGIDARSKVEARMRQLEGRTLVTDGAKPRGKEQPTPYDKTKQAGTNGLAAVPKAYNADADVAVPE